MTPRLRTRVARAAAGTPEAGSAAAGAPRPAPATKLADSSAVGLVDAGTGAWPSNGLPLLALPGALGNRATQQLLTSGLLFPRPGADRSAGTLLVDDGVAPAAGQMTRSAFLAELRAALSAAADAAFAGTEHESRGCPWIEATLRFYEGRDAARLEHDLRVHAPEAAEAATARDALVPIAERVRQGVATWVETGAITGLPPGLPGAGLARMLAGGRGAALTGLLAKLGEGRPLASTTRSRMERALGHRFGEVRVHHDDEAARLAHQHSARAFAVGQHVAFGAGEYRPGTPAGDVLLAHELAHVVQQGGARAPGASISSSGHARLERDADRSALAGAATLWRAPREVRERLGKPGRPRLRSGLALQRCPTKREEGSPFGDDFAVGQPERLAEAQKAKESLANYRANPKVYDPSYFVGVTIKVAQEEYFYDFSVTEESLSTQCADSSSAGCTQVSSVDAPQSSKIIAPDQQIGNVTVPSPLEIRVNAFTYKLTVFIPGERILENNTLEHELHHVADAYLVLRDFEDRAARAIRKRVMAARSEVAQHPERASALISRTAVGQIVTEELDRFYAAIKGEIEYRSAVQHDAGEPTTKADSRPEFSANFVRPPATSGARGSLAKPQPSTGAAGQGMSTPQPGSKPQPSGR